MPKIKNTANKSEVHAYVFIFKQLTEKKGWKKTQIYTQQECHQQKEIKKFLALTKPENVVEVNSKTFYVIEAKNDRNKLEQALREAREDYADKINQSKIIQAPFITGIAGNQEEGFIAKSEYYKNGKWTLITENNVELTGLLSTEQIMAVLNSDNPNISDVEITEEEFLKAAEMINEILQENSINKDYRARFISAILLAMAEGNDINVAENPTVLIAGINTRVELLLKGHKKGDFAKFIRIDEPSSIDNHIKVKNAIVKTYQELLGLNIRSAMRSGKDVLGKFYEVFLKYGNGAKEIGIVLTPRHITKFAAGILDIQVNDIVLDPACGTGGFLVSAFDEAQRKDHTEKEFETFKHQGLYGIEEQDPIIALAIVNMIFRGDGKTNMIEGNCFKKWLNAETINGTTKASYSDTDNEGRIPPITKVLMNPPFAKKMDDEKECRFIEHALKQMQKDGLLFTVLPTSVMVKQGQYYNWRKDSLLRENTLLSVITFPNDLFYSAGGSNVGTCGVILKKGTAHPKNQNVLWIKIIHDGYLKSKGKRLPNKREQNEFDLVFDLIKDFIKNPNIKVKNIQEFQKASTIDFSDGNLELLPEVYLDEKTPTDGDLKKKIDSTLRDFISLIVKTGNMEEFKNEVVNKQKNFFGKLEKIEQIKLVEKPITELFENPIKTGKYHVSGALDEGKIPLVSCVSENGGFEGFFDVEESVLTKKAITIACDGTPLTSFYHFYPFVAKDNVLICRPIKEYKFTTLLFFTTLLNSLQWRFSYGRKCYENKVHKIKIFLPVDKSGDTDENYIENLFRQTDAWKLLEKLSK